jgi:hypothetical protein
VESGPESGTVKEDAVESTALALGRDGFASVGAAAESLPAGGVTGSGGMFTLALESTPAREEDPSLESTTGEPLQPKRRSDIVSGARRSGAPQVWRDKSFTCRPMGMLSKTCRERSSKYRGYGASSRWGGVWIAK